MLSLNENIAKSFRGATFFDSHCMCQMTLFRNFVLKSCTFVTCQITERSDRSRIETFYISCYNLNSIAFVSREEKRAQMFDALVVSYGPMLL